MAFYATARDKLDVTAWDYGYLFYPRWRAPHGTSPAVTTYTEGSVIIHVLPSNDRTLLWHGEGRAQLTDDPSENVVRLGQAAQAIIAQFPASTVVNVAALR